jgi:hypothetical protein
MKRKEKKRKRKEKRKRVPVLVLSRGLQSGAIKTMIYYEVEILIMRKNTATLEGYNSDS